MTRFYHQGQEVIEEKSMVRFYKNYADVSYETAEFFFPGSPWWWCVDLSGVLFLTAYTSRNKYPLFVRMRFAHSLEWFYFQVDLCGEDAFLRERGLIKAGIAGCVIFLFGSSLEEAESSCIAARVEYGAPDYARR